MAFSSDGINHFLIIRIDSEHIGVYELCTVIRAADLTCVHSVVSLMRLMYFLFRNQRSSPQQRAWTLDLPHNTPSSLHHRLSSEWLVHTSSMHTCTQGLCIQVHKLYAYMYTSSMNTSTQGLCLHVHKVYAYVYTRSMHTCTQAL